MKKNHLPELVSVMRIMAQLLITRVTLPKRKPNKLTNGANSSRYLHSILDYSNWKKTNTSWKLLHKSQMLRKLDTWRPMPKMGRHCTWLRLILRILWQMLLEIWKKHKILEVISTKRTCATHMLSISNMVMSIHTKSLKNTGFKMLALS